MNEQFYNTIQQTFNNGYYIYSFVIGFKPGGIYDSIHPAKAHRQFEETFKKYLARHSSIKYIVFGELSQQGRYHIHGLLFDKCSDYDEHDKRFRNLKNYIHRRYGWHGMQRIYSLTDPYKTTDQRFHNRQWSTTFQKVWTYIIKDVDKFPFLYPFYSKLLS